MRERRVIWLVRHGERVDNIDGNWKKTASRWDDPPLSARGEQQAQEVGERLARESISAVFSSPFTRCVQTAAAILREQPPSTRPSLRIEGGLAESLNACNNPPGRPSQQQIRTVWAEIDDSYAAVYDVLPAEYGGDIGCYQRVSNTVKHLLDSTSGNIIIVSHGSPIAAIHLFLTSRWGYVGQCSLSRVVQTDCGSFRSTILGDSSHLRDRSNLHSEQSKSGEREKALALEEKVRAERRREKERTDPLSLPESDM